MYCLRNGCLLWTVLLLVGCGSAPGSEDGSSSPPPRDVPSPVAVEAADSLADRLVSRVDAAFQRIAVLTRSEQSTLRRYIQDDHIEFARRIGIDPIADRRVAGRLMARPGDGGVVHVRTNDYFIVDPRMGFAVPLLVPSAAHALQALSVQFQKELRSAGLPPYRFILTSILRTVVDQSILQGSNVNAASGESTHEFGTTFDVYYDRYHYSPAIDSVARSVEASGKAAPGRLRQRLHTTYRTYGEDQSERLKAVLGRTILALQADGLLMVTYERRQPVFHVTVSRHVSTPALPRVESPLRSTHAEVESVLADVDDEIRGFEREERGGQGLDRLKTMRDALRRDLDAVDPLSDFDADALRRRMAQLEGQVARTDLAFADTDQGTSYRLENHLRRADLAITQLEARAEYSPDDFADRYGSRIAALRSQHNGLSRSLAQMENGDAPNTGADDRLASLIADLALITAELP